MRPRQLQSFRHGVFALAFALLGALAGPVHAAWTDTPSAGLQTTDVGLRPKAVAVHAGTRLAVAANEEGSSVSLVNIDTGTTNSLPLAESPIDVSIDATKALAYVLHKAGAVSVVDLNAGIRTAQWSTGSGEFKAIAVHPAGHELAILAEEPHRLVRLDATTGAIKQSIALTEEAEALAFAADGSHLYIAEDDAGISVYETAGWTELAPIPVDDVKAMGYWSEGQRLIAIDKRQLHIIDPITKAVESISVGAGLRRVTIDGVKGIAYAADKETNAVAAIDLSTKAYQGRFALIDEPADLAADASTGKVLVALKKANRLLRLDPAVAVITPSVYLGEKLRDVAVDNNANHATAIAERERAFIINLGDKTNKEITLPSKPLVVAADESRGLAVIGLEKSDLRFLDVATQALAPEIVSLDSKPVAIAIDKARGLAVLALDKKDQLLLVDVANRKLLKTIATAGDFRAVAVHSGQGKAYAFKKDKGQGTLVVLDLNTQAVTGSIAVSKDTKSLVIDEALDLAVLAVEEGDRIEVLDLKTGEIARSHELRKHPHTLALNRDTHTVVIAAKDSDQIALLDLTTQTLTANFAALEKPQQLDVTSRHNQALVIASEQGEIVFVQLPNPVPVLTEIVPPDVTAPAPSFALLVVGQHFINSSKVTLNDTALTTRWKDHQHLEADVPANLLSAAGVYPVKVVTPGLAGGESQTINFTVNNPVPVLTAISPVEILAGSPDRALTVTGQNFVATSVVRLGIADLVTTFVDEQHLTAVIPAAMLANPAVIPVTVFNPVPGGGSSNFASLTVLQAGPRIDSVTPSSGEPGDLITIAGSGFEPLAMENQVSFGGNVAGVVQVATATELRLTVPPGAVTGPITVKTAKGEAKSPVFTVNLPQDFELIASPATVTLIQNASNTFSVQLTSTGTQSFTSLVRLAAQGLPEGVTARFSPQAITGNQTVALTLGASATALPETFTFTVAGTATLNGRETTRTAQATVTLHAAGQTGVKGRFVDPAGRGVPGVYVRHDTVETTSDAAGNFLLLGLPAGKVTLRMDATPANPLYPIWPFQVDVEANKVLVLADWVINPPPTADKFIPLQQNAPHDQVVTDERYPGLKITIPAGVSIIGWDGVPKDRMAVERIDINQLPVPPPPVPIKESYQLYFGTPMGGIPSQPIPITLPNVTGLEPGEKTEIWYFDGSPMGGSGEWKLAGPATIGADGATVSTDPGYGIPRFCGVCGLASAKCPDLPSGDPTGPQQCKAGNPVDLLSGYEMPTFSGLRCGGLTPLELGISYHPVDTFQGRSGLESSIGQGWILDHDIVLTDSNQLPGLKRLLLPPHQRIAFTLQPDGTYTAPGNLRFDGAVLRLAQTSPRTWELKLKDGRIWRFGHTDSIGVTASFLTEIVDPRGNTTYVNRRLPDRKITSIGNGQRNYTLKYGASGLVEEITDPVARSVRFTYNAQRRIETITDADGGVTRYTYVGDDEFPAQPLCPQGTDGLRIKQIEYPGKTTPTINYHGSSRRVLRQTGPDGEYRFAYKLAGACVVNVSNPGAVCAGVNCPNVDSWENYAAGWRIYGGQVVATTVTDPAGKGRTHEFSGGGYVKDTHDGFGNRTIRKLDAQNRVVQETDALGRTTRYFYDDKGNKIREIDALNQVTAYEYDPKWNKLTQILRAKEDGTEIALSQFTYDVNTGNLTSQRDANGNTTTFAYTAKGQLDTITDANNKKTRLSYNEFGDLQSVIDPLGHPVKLSSDPVGRVIETQDALGYRTRFMLNSRDQQTRVLDAANGTTQFEYDVRGNLVKVTNQNGQAIQSNTYDDQNRLLTRTDGAGKTETFIYDGNGNVETYTDRKGLTTEYTYDENNRIVRIVYADGEAQTRSYDSVGRLVAISDNSGSIGYEYDVLDRITQVTTPQGSVKYTYDVLNRRTKLETPYQTVTYSYDDAGNLTAITQGEDVTTIEYDKTNRRAQLTYPNGIVATYSIDGTGRLTGLLYQKDEAIIEYLTYDYDPNGNVIQRTRIGAGSKQESAKNGTYDPKTNRLLSLNDETFAYDDNGNLLSWTNSCGITRYVWDARNRLTEIQGFKPDCSALSAKFAYDALGHRVSRTINGEATTYLYDGLDVIAEIGASRADYLRTANIDEAIGRYTQGDARYVLGDLLGSTVALTDGMGIAKTVYSYSSFGETKATGDESNNAVQYTGRENDGTGLYYYRARYYSPEIGRFIASDPIGIEGGLNTYLYAEANPLLYTDPLGLYGTTSCGYYAEACQAIGGYACAAQHICPVFPTGRENGWWQCVRQCLQEEHKRRSQECPSSEHVDNAFTDHTTCFAACAVNSSNPAMPSDSPARPSEDIRW